jgi:hypothetical protein
MLLVLGVIGLVHPNFNYHQQEEVAKLGPIKATADEEKTAQNPGSGLDNSAASRHRACGARAAHEAVAFAIDALDWHSIRSLPQRSNSRVANTFPRCFSYGHLNAEGTCNLSGVT